MQVSRVLAHLPHGAESYRSLADPEANVYTVSFIVAGGTLRDDVLYFGEASALASLDLKSAPLNIAVFGDADPALDEQLATCDNLNVVVLAADANALACYNALQELFIEDQAQIGVIRRMMMAHFSNKGVAYLVDESAKALGNPIDVIDTAYHHIAYSLGVDDAELSDSAKRLDAVLTGEQLSDEQIDYISSSGIDSELANTQGPLVRHNHIVDANTMTRAVMANGVCIAFVMLIELHRPFRASDTDCFERFAEFVGQEMQKSEVWQPAVGEMGSYFLTNLLGNASPSEAVTLRRVKELNFHQRSVLYVLCLHVRGEGLQQLQAERIAAHLRPQTGSLLYTRFHQNLVVLYSQDDDAGIDRKMRHLLTETATLNELTVGISNPFTRFTGTRKAYGQARAAIRLGQAEHKGLQVGKIHDYRDYADLHLFEIASRRSNLTDFCHPALAKLQEYDVEHGTELMDTLYCFLMTSGSNARSAELLNLHKNSMLYRMGKIAKVAGIDLSSGELRYRLFSGMRILMYQNAFRPRISPPREDHGTSQGNRERNVT